MESNSDRVVWIDELKGIGIIFVMLYHNYGTTGFLQNYSILFNVPLFFFVSGFVLSSCQKYNFLDFLAKQTNRIVVPYFFFALLSVTPWLYGFHEMNTNAPIEIRETFLGILYGTFDKGALAFNPALWFLPCLFVSSIIYYILTKYGDRTVLIAFLLLTIGIAYAFTKVTTRLPWGLDIAPYGLYFMLLGNLTRPYIDGALQKVHGHLSLLLFGALVLISFIATDINGHNGMGTKHYNNFALYFIGATAAIASWVMLARHSNWFGLIGRHSMIIFALHITMYFVLNTIIATVLKLEIRYDTTSTALIYVVFSLIALVPTSILLKKYMPNLVGGAK